MFLWTNHKNFVRLLKRLQKIDMRTIYPVAFKCVLVRMEKGDSMALVYNVTAGPVVDSDVSERRLTVTVNGNDSGTTTYPSDTTAFGELKFSDNDNVVLTLLDVDDAGNVSSPAVAEFVATDTIAPVSPGEFGVTLVREE